MQDLALSCTGGRHKIRIEFRRNRLEDAGRQNTN